MLRIEKYSVTTTTAVSQWTWNRSTSTLMKRTMLFYLRATDTCLRTTVDTNAPLVSWTITVRPMTPWHTNDLTEEKRAVCRAERLWRKSGLTVHRQVFSYRRNTFQKQPALNTADPRSRKLAATSASSIVSQIHSLVNRAPPEMANESYSALATRFQRNTTEKIEALYHN